MSLVYFPVALYAPNSVVPWKDRERTIAIAMTGDPGLHEVRAVRVGGDLQLNASKRTQLVAHVALERSIRYRRGCPSTSTNAWPYGGAHREFSGSAPRCVLSR